MLKLQKVMGALEVTLLWISVVCNVATAQRTDPVPIGNGTNIVGVKNSNYDAFNGIPFAEPPVGKLRFAVSGKTVWNFSNNWCEVLGH